MSQTGTGLHPGILLGPWSNMSIGAMLTQKTGSVYRSFERNVVDAIWQDVAAMAVDDSIDRWELFIDLTTLRQINFHKISE